MLDKKTQELQLQIHEIFRQNQWKLATNDILQNIKAQINEYLNNNDYGFECRLVQSRTGCLIVNFNNDQIINIQLH